MANNDSPTDLDGRIAWIDEDSAAPFPTKETSSGARVHGPGFHLAPLSVSRDFWDDRSAEVIETAEEGIEADRDEVAAALTERWGPPEVIDLEPYLEADLAGAEVPDPVGHLCSGVDLWVWLIPSTGRWVGLSVVQDDRELPFVLYAAVGGEPFPPPPEIPVDGSGLRIETWSPPPPLPPSLM